MQTQPMNLENNSGFSFLSSDAPSDAPPSTGFSFIGGDDPAPNSGGDQDSGFSFLNSGAAQDSGFSFITEPADDPKPSPSISQTPVTKSVTPRTQTPPVSSSTDFFAALMEEQNSKEVAKQAEPGKGEPCFNLWELFQEYE